MLPSRFSKPMLQNVSPIPSPIKMSCYLHFIHHTDIIGYIPTLYCTHQESHPSSQSSEESKQSKILQKRFRNNSKNSKHMVSNIKNKDLCWVRYIRKMILSVSRSIHLTLTLHPLRRLHSLPVGQCLPRYWFPGAPKIDVTHYA